MSTPDRQYKGPLAWMTRNSVAANLLMFALLFGGLLFLTRTKQEVFPSVELDTVTVAVPYPGASPEEVERAITSSIEEAVRGISGVDEVQSTSAEGVAQVSIQLELGTNPDRALSDVKAAIDRISTLPEDAEEATVSLAEFKQGVVSVLLYGDTSEKVLHALAERTRDELLAQEGISKAELVGARSPEISIEVPQSSLRAYGLTLDQVAAAVRGANIELPAGSIRAVSGEVMLRTTERRDFGGEFGDIVVLSRPDGSEVKLSQIATVVDGFREPRREMLFMGTPAARIQVYRVGRETPVEVADAVRKFIAEHEKDLPPGVHIKTWRDRSRMFVNRMDLLRRNATSGLLLVLFCLGLFLEIRLAFWVTLGIPLSFLGSLLFLPSWGVSINMISLFAFIVTLGIVVDDAIVVGEAIHQRKQEGMPAARAAVVGLHDVAKPVVFSVLTTVVAFSPLLFVPGTMGKFFRNIPTVVISVLLLSLVECLLILPAHLAHANPIAVAVRRLLESVFGERLGPFGWLYRLQQRFGRAFDGAVNQYFQPFVERAVRVRYLTIAASIMILVVTFGFVASGRLNFTFSPKIPADMAVATLEMPVGTSYEYTKQRTERILETLEEVIAEEGGMEASVEGVLTTVGGTRKGTSSNMAEVWVYLKDPDVRLLQTEDLVRKWRARLAGLPGARSLKFLYTTGTSNAAPISVGVSHRDKKVAEAAARDLGALLADFSGVFDIDDGVAQGKRQVDFQLKSSARTLGIDSTKLARQLRAGFFGVEASRQQRGREELRVFVRLPKKDRTSLHGLEELLIRTDQGGELTVGTAATLSWGQAYTAIDRVNFQRVVPVEADVDEGITTANKVMAALKKEALPSLKKKYPGLTFISQGAQKSEAESLAALATGFQLALLVMFALMAIPFKSYAQPLIIMAAIPFGLVGAIGGHVLMGYDLSILSAMGFVALSGVVVNDSLVLITAVNEFREAGMTPFEAVVSGATRRFRPIFLTSMTTFLGLAPMIVETSVQARFLVPMALSLGFGVLFTTFIILLLVPSLYMALEDVKRALSIDDAEAVASAPAE